uniref:Uncharacterized protein n=1 Tax=Ditylenchus dipsaci TaxID=166011 RepID=A0A915D483_9BILA
MSEIQEKACEISSEHIEVGAQEKSGAISDGEIQVDLQETDLKEPKLILKSLLSKKPQLVHDVVGLNVSGPSCSSPQKFFTPQDTSESKQYQRKVFMQVEESRTPGQWIDYGKCNGITDDKLLPTILKGMSNLTVDRFDKDVQNIMSRIEGGTPVIQEQLPPRLNACTVYPDPNCSFGVTRDVTVTHDGTLMEEQTQKFQPNLSKMTQSNLKTPVVDAVSTFTSSFGTRRAATPSATPGLERPPIISLETSPAVFFEEQSSTPKNLPVHASGDRIGNSEGRETPLNFNGGGASFFTKDGGETHLPSKTACFGSNRSSHAVQYNPHHVSTPSGSVRNGISGVKDRVDGSVVSSNANMSRLLSPLQVQ